MNLPDLENLLASALAPRRASISPEKLQAMRLFNGFYEGCPDLSVDLYGKTLVFFNYAEPAHAGQPLVQAAQAFYRQTLPWVKAGLVKTRQASASYQNEVLFGKSLDDRVQENGIWYAINLSMHRDASLYLDTRELRRWALDHLQGLRVLNTFAYTGSLGVAAAAAGAKRVVQLDLNRRFLNLAQRSYMLNGLSANPSDFLVGDFFTWVSRLKRQAEQYDCVFLDPPFFSVTQQGRVDQVSESHRLINKVRPLVADGGWLVTINNALFVSGAAYLETLQKLCADGYLTLEALIPVPPDFTGYPETITAPPPTDPAPFNHPTKIAILRVAKKV